MGQTQGPQGHLQWEMSIDTFSVLLKVVEHSHKVQTSSSHSDNEGLPVILGFWNPSTHRLGPLVPHVLSTNSIGQTQIRVLKNTPIASCQILVGEEVFLFSAQSRTKWDWAHYFLAHQASFTSNYISFNFQPQPICLMVAFCSASSRSSGKAKSAWVFPANSTWKRWKKGQKWRPKCWGDHGHVGKKSDGTGNGVPFWISLVAGDSIEVPGFHYKGTLFKIGKKPDANKYDSVKSRNKIKDK